MAFSGSDKDNLRQVDEKCFILIKKLWEGVSQPSELHLIRTNYGIVRISKGLTLENAFAVKGITSILLYLSISYPEDFINDEFFENFHSALQYEDNDVNYFLLARLIRLLQINKNFGDWMLNEKGVVRSLGYKHFFENKVWDRLYEISKADDTDEEVRKESSRAVKEGTRVGAVEGQSCIIPEKNIERMKKEHIWSITDADVIRLDELSKEKNYTGDNQNLPRRILELKQENETLKRNNEEHMKVLTEKTEKERAEKESVQDELAQARSQLRELTDKETDAQLNIPSINVSELGDLVKDVIGLSSMVRALRNDHLTSKQAVADLAEEVRKLKTLNANKSKEIQDLKRDLHKFIDESLQEVVDSLLPIIQSKISGELIPSTPNATASRSLSASYSASPSSSSKSVTPAPPSVDDLELPPGWEKKFDPQSNRFYYINKAAKKTQWKPPAA